VLPEKFLVKDCAANMCTWPLKVAQANRVTKFELAPGKWVRLLALDGRNAELAGGLSSNPILSGLRRTDLEITILSKI
jgi:hypothetical protein